MRIRFFREGLFQLVVGVGEVSIIALFALVNENWTWPNAFVGGVLLLCGLLYLNPPTPIAAGEFQPGTVGFLHWGCDRARHKRFRLPS